jgi:fucose permease
MPELYPGREGFANNFAQAFFGAGAAVGPLLLLWGGLSWRLRLAAGSAAFVLLAAVLWAQRRHDRPALLPSPGPRRDLPIPTRRTAKGPRGSGPLRLLAAPGLAAAAGAMLLYTGVEVALWDWLFAVVTRPGGAGPAWAVAELSGFWVAMGAGRLWTAALAERVSLPLLITAGCALGIVALPLALLAPTPAGDLAAGVLCGLAFAGIWPSLVALGQRRCGQSALVSSVLVASGGAGALAIPAAFGFGAARLGLGPAAVALAALLVPVAILPWATPAPPGSGPADRPVLAPGAGPSGATGTG